MLPSCCSAPGHTLSLSDSPWGKLAHWHLTSASLAAADGTLVGLPLALTSAGRELLCAAELAPSCGTPALGMGVVGGAFVLERASLQDRTLFRLYHAVGAVGGEGLGMSAVGGGEQAGWACHMETNVLLSWRHPHALPGKRGALRAAHIPGRGGRLQRPPAAGAVGSWRGGCHLAAAAAAPHRRPAVSTASKRPKYGQSPCVSCIVC